MKKIQTVIVGTRPLLTDRFSEDCLEAPTRRTLIKKQTPQDTAEKSTYRNAEGQFCFPASAVKRLIRESGGNHKMKGSRKSVKFLIPSAVQLTDEFLILTNGDGKSPLTSFCVDSRSVVNRATRGRRMCHRAKFEKWSIRFTMFIEDTLLECDFVKQLLNEGGKMIGVGAFRMELGGQFGTFNVAEWCECET